MDWTALTAVAGLATGGAALANAWLNRGRKSADDSSATEAVSRAAAELIAPMRARIKELQSDLDRQSGELAALKAQQEKNVAELAKLRSDLAQYKAGVDILIRQIIQMGMTPLFRPPEEKP